MSKHDLSSENDESFDQYFTDDEASKVTSFSSLAVTSSRPEEEEEAEYERWERIDLGGTRGSVFRGPTFRKIAAPGKSFPESQPSKKSPWWRDFSSRYRQTAQEERRIWWRRSQYRGVSFCRKRSRWESRIWNSGRLIYLGSFDTETKAAGAFDIAAVEHKGKEAITNFDPMNYVNKLQPKYAKQQTGQTMVINFCPQSEPDPSARGFSFEAISTRCNGINLDRGWKIILDCITNCDVCKIGVYGGSKVGRMTMIESLEDQPVIRKMFELVILVKVSEDWNLSKMQLQILRQIPGSKTDQNEHLHSKRLYDLLEHTKFLIILNDVEKLIDLEIVGIPEPSLENGCKIVLTTRLEQVCNEMEVDVKIRFADLLSWDLFCQNIGEIVFPNFQSLASQVVDLCCHYPDAIMVMAGALKDVPDVSIWNNAVQSLSSQSVPEQEKLANIMLDSRDISLQLLSLDEETLDEEKLENIMSNVLKFSYKCLQDDISRKCFLSCAKFGNFKFDLGTESLIDSWLRDGLVYTYHNGWKVLETLIGANLLKSLEVGQFVRLTVMPQHKSINQIILGSEYQPFLMQGGMGLTEPPKDEDWVRAKEIYLMGNELTLLPQKIKCPKLQALFLQRNCRLRKIPPSFFDHIPALQVLDLSRTSIESLPESLFMLMNLARLYLSYCHLLKTLSPRISVLKCLEILDLEGTEINDLPREVGKLTNLTCLKVSFAKPTNYGRSELLHPLVPHRVISALSQLEELSVDVNPDDERWNGCVESVASEVCHLTKLKTLKFYFPKMELLSHFKLKSTPMWCNSRVASLPLSNFRFTAGNEVSRMISRLPQDAKWKLEQYCQYLRYVNGSGFPRCIKDVVRHSSALFLDCHTTIQKLSELGFGNMMQLKCLVVGECNELQAIEDEDDVYSEPSVLLPSLEYLCIFYMKNFRSICEGKMNKSGFFSLKSLTLHTCPQLTAVFTQGLVANLHCLEELTLYNCSTITSLVDFETTPDTLPNLKRISLHYLPQLCSIFNGSQVPPRVEWMSFYHCPNIKTLPVSKISNINLKRIKGEISWWKALEWEGAVQNSWDDIFVPVIACD